MTSTAAAELTIATRFRGPARSGNGGYTAGALAERVESDGDCPVIEVTLRQPPPLEVAMSVDLLQPSDPANVTGAPTAALSFGGSRIAEGRAVETELEPVEAVDLSTAADAMARFPGRVSHPFPTCFSCGLDRAEGDGLRIFPGKVAEDRVAALWVPHPSLAVSSDLLDAGLQRVGVPVAWAALDCVGGWAGDLEGRRMVLGRITATLDALPVVGEPHVVVGQMTGGSGRKTFTASTLYDSDGRVVARAEHVWIEIDPDAFN
jgi:hypothetical protein